MGEIIYTLPRGFYLRAIFTTQIYHRLNLESFQV
jgi:DNA mismatch repair protein MutH